MNDETIKYRLSEALADIDTGSDPDAFTIKTENVKALADRLEPEFRQLMSLAWCQGANKGIEWAQGDASQPLTNPYEEQE